MNVSGMVPRSYCTASDMTSCKKGLSNPNGFKPTLWGNDMWHLLRMIAWAHPIVDKSVKKSRGDIYLARKYKSFFESLVYVLPCGVCCTHYARIISGKRKKGIREQDTGDPCVLTNTVACSRRSLTRWLYNIQNCVSATLGNDISTVPSYNSVRLRYSRAAGGSDTPPQSLEILRCLLFVAWNFPKKASPARMRGYITFFKTLAHVLPTRRLRNWYAGVIASSDPFMIFNPDGSVGHYDGIIMRSRLTRWVVSLWSNGTHNPATYNRVCKWIGKLRK